MTAGADCVSGLLMREFEHIPTVAAVHDHCQPHALRYFDYQLNMPHNKQTSMGKKKELGELSTVVDSKASSPEGQAAESVQG